MQLSPLEASLPDLCAKAAAMPHPEHRALLADHAQCETHGAYVIQAEVSPGRWQVSNPGGCPQCLAERRASRLMAEGNMPARFAGATFESYEAADAKQARVLEVCRDYAQNFATYRKQGRCLIMCGNPGTGKNHLATAIFKTLHAAGFTALRVKASEFLDAFWAKEFKERDDWLRGMFRVDLLILDEVEKCSKGEPAKNAMFRLIDGRYEAMSPTLVITNQARAELVETLGEPAYDRLTEGGSQRLVFDWPSRRAAMNRSEA
jgi:DNA replication protein DnaC